MEKSLELIELIEFYKKYIEDKEVYVKNLESSEHFVTSHYFYQSGLLHAYRDMLSSFIEILGGD